VTLLLAERGSAIPTTRRMGLGRAGQGRAAQHEVHYWMAWGGRWERGAERMDAHGSSRVLPVGFSWRLLASSRDKAHRFSSWMVSLEAPSSSTL